MSVLQGSRRLPPWLERAGSVAVIGAVLAWGLVSDLPPAVVSSSAPASEFSAARARAHLEAIARAPRPRGSAAHEAARSYLTGQLRGLGFEVEEQATLSPSRWRPGAPPSPLVNLLARKRGSAGGLPLLLMAHYDSVPAAPGASDDGFGVAALLETARALSVGPALGTDLLILLTDGEEEGLLGARAFVASHPVFAGGNGLGLVMNFEARGDSGPVFMFQSSPGNGALVAELAGAAPWPRASSLTQAVYQRLPNDTDLTVFLEAEGRPPCLNFANIGGVRRYHQPTDTIENADLRTLQHHGSYALSLARAFGGRRLPLPAAPDATYFDVGSWLVHYAAGWDLPLGAAGGLALIASAVVARRRGAWTSKRLLTSLGRALGSLAGSFGLGAAGAWLCSRASEGVQSTLMIGCALAGLALGALAQRRAHAGSVWAGALTTALFAALMLAFVPGGAFLFLWPLAGIAAASWSPRLLPLCLAASLPAAMLVGSLLPQLADAFGVFAAPLVGLLAAQAAWMMAPLVGRLRSPPT